MNHMIEEGQIIELGNASILTLGNGGWMYEIGTKLGNLG